MDPDAETSRHFRNYEAQQKYAHHFSNQTQLDHFLRLPVATSERDDFLRTLHAEWKKDNNAEQIAQIESVLDGLAEQGEEGCPTTPSPSPK